MLPTPTSPPCTVRSMESEKDVLVPEEEYAPESFPQLVKLCCKNQKDTIFDEIRDRPEQFEDFSSAVLDHLFECDHCMRVAFELFEACKHPQFATKFISEGYASVVMELLSRDSFPRRELPELQVMLKTPKALNYTEDKLMVGKLNFNFDKADFLSSTSPVTELNDPLPSSSKDRAMNISPLKFISRQQTAPSPTRPLETVRSVPRPKTRGYEPYLTIEPLPARPYRSPSSVPRPIRTRRNVAKFARESPYSKRARPRTQRTGRAASSPKPRTGGIRRASITLGHYHTPISVPERTCLKVPLPATRGRRAGRSKSVQPPRRWKEALLLRGMSPVPPHSQRAAQQRVTTTRRLPKMPGPARFVSSPRPVGELAPSHLNLNLKKIESTTSVSEIDSPLLSAISSSAASSFRALSVPAGADIPRLRLTDLPGKRDSRIHRRDPFNGDSLPTKSPQESSRTQNAFSLREPQPTLGLNFQAALGVPDLAKQKKDKFSQKLDEQRVQSQGLGEIKEMSEKLGEYLIMRHLPAISRLKKTSVVSAFPATRVRRNIIYKFETSFSPRFKFLLLPLRMASEWGVFSHFSANTVANICQQLSISFFPQENRTTFYRAILTLSLWLCLRQSASRRFEIPGLSRQLVSRLLSLMNSQFCADGAKYSLIEALSYTVLLREYERFENDMKMQMWRTVFFMKDSFLTSAAGPSRALRNIEEAGNSLFKPIESPRQFFYTLDNLRRSFPTSMTGLSTHLFRFIPSALSNASPNEICVTLGVLADLLEGISDSTMLVLSFEHCADILLKIFEHIGTHYFEDEFVDFQFALICHRLLRCFDALVCSDDFSAETFFSKVFGARLSQDINPRNSRRTSQQAKKNSIIIERIRIFFSTIPKYVHPENLSCETVFLNLFVDSEKSIGWFKRYTHMVLLEPAFIHNIISAGKSVPEARALLAAFRTRVGQHMSVIAHVLSRSNRSGVMDINENLNQAKRMPLPAIACNPPNKFSRCNPNVAKFIGVDNFGRTKSENSFDHNPRPKVDLQEHSAFSLAQRSKLTRPASLFDDINEVKLGMDKSVTRGDVQTLRVTRAHPLSKFSFLVDPSCGFIPEFMNRNQNLKNQLECAAFLNALETLFNIAGNPFVLSADYCDHYISYHYFQFLRFYFTASDNILSRTVGHLPTSSGKMRSTRKVIADMAIPEEVPSVNEATAVDRDTFRSDYNVEFVNPPSILEMAALHLKVLQAFGRRRSEYARRKFNQLGVVIFLAGELNFEMNSALRVNSMTKTWTNKKDPASNAHPPKSLQSSFKLKIPAASSRNVQSARPAAAKKEALSPTNSRSQSVCITNPGDAFAARIPPSETFSTANEPHTPTDQANPISPRSLSGIEGIPEHSVQPLKLPLSGGRDGTFLAQTLEEIPSNQFREVTEDTRDDVSDMFSSYSYDYSEESLDCWAETATRLGIQGRDGSENRLSHSLSDHELVSPKTPIVQRTNASKRSVESSPIASLLRPVSMNTINRPKLNEISENPAPRRGKGSADMPLAMKLNLTSVSKKGDPAIAGIEKNTIETQHEQTSYAKDISMSFNTHESGLSKLESLVNKGGVGAKFQLFLGARTRSHPFLGDVLSEDEGSIPLNTSIKFSETDVYDVSQTDLETTARFDEFSEKLSPKSPSVFQYSPKNPSADLDQPLYTSKILHLTILELLVCLLILPPLHILDPLYTPQFPANHNLPNILCILYYHLNHPRNQILLPDLMFCSERLGPGAMRLMRLLCKVTFNENLYPLKRLKKIGAGAYGTVYAGAVSVSNKRILSHILPASSSAQVATKLSSSPLANPAPFPRLNNASSPEEGAEAANEARGLFSSVFHLDEGEPTPQLTETMFKHSIAIKVLPYTANPYDRSVIRDIFSEVSILEKFGKGSHICQLFDYGVTNDSYFIVMKRYTCSLKAWRTRVANTCMERLGFNVDNKNIIQSKLPCAPGLSAMVCTGHELSMMCYISVLLRVYYQIASAIMFMHNHGVIHHDIKCENIFLHPIQNPEEWFAHRQLFEKERLRAENDERMGDMTKGVDIFDPWTWPSGALPIYCSIGDFGESMMFAREDESYTEDNRGTEYIKSPEMLMVANASRKMKAGYDRRKPQGASSPSDVWGCACLLFELLTGDFLFYDPDWIRFFIRVTTPGQRLLSPEKEAMIGNCRPILQFFEKVLVRQQNWRPKMQNVLRLVDHLIETQFGPETEEKTQRFFEEFSFFPHGDGEGKIPYIPPPGAEGEWDVSFWNFGVNPRGLPLAPNPAELIAPQEHHLEEERVQDPSISSRTLSTRQPENVLLEIEAVFGQRLYSFFPFLSVGSAASAHLVTWADVLLICCDDSTAASAKARVLHLPPAIARLGGLKRGRSFSPAYLLHNPSIKTKPFRQYGEEDVIALIQSTREVFFEFVQALYSVFDMIRSCAIGEKFCCLVDQSGNAMAAGVGIAFQMEARGSTLSLAYTDFRTRRFNVRIPSMFLRFLALWDLFREKQGMRMGVRLLGTVETFSFATMETPRYQCLCGKTFFILTSRVAVDIAREVRCDCCHRRDPSMATSTGCPSPSCAVLVCRLNTFFRMCDEEAVWTILPERHVVSNHELTTTRTQVTVPLGSLSIGPKVLGERGGWQLFRCTVCECVTHGTHPESGEIAIFSNFPIR